MSNAAQDHMRRAMAQPVLMQEFERWLRSGDHRMEEFEGMMSDRGSTVSEGTTRIHDDLYIWFRQNRAWERPEITLLMITEAARPGGPRMNIRMFDCAIICGVIFTYDYNGAHLIMGNNLTEPTGHWTLADDDQMGNAALKLMMVNRER